MTECWREGENKDGKGKFSRLVEGDIEAERLLDGGQTMLDKAAVAVIYAAREWCAIEAKVLAERLTRDASMISRSHAA
jgi:hypothetical protein